MMQNEKIKILSTHFLKNRVFLIRKKLAKKYDVISPDSEYFNYRGLCEIATHMLIKSINTFNEKHDTDFSIKGIHGEQKHSAVINPDKWKCQHTWCKIFNGEKYIYVDITASQFKCLYHDIPNVYTSDIPPKWYLADADNIYWKYYRKWPSISNKFDPPESLISMIIRIFDFKIWRNVCILRRKLGERN